MTVFLCINTGLIFISGAIQLSGFRISQIYTTYVNDSQLMSENVNTLVEKTWYAMKEMS